MNKLLLITLLFAFSTFAFGQSDELSDNYEKYIEHYEKGEYEQALPYAKKALELELVAFGKNHEYYSIFLNNLAGIYLHLGDYNKALPLYLEALESSEKVLGQMHPTYGISLNNLAELYRNMGEFDKAVPLYIGALKNTENTLGKEHPDYGIGLNNLALLYESKGEYNKALPLFVEALSNTENAFGKENPAYGRALNNLAYLYESIGDYKMALTLYLEALANVENFLGKEHPSYGVSLSNLAGVYSSLGEYEKALPLYLAALDNTEKALGKAHPSYGIRLNNLAFLYESMGGYEKALPLYLTALEIKEITIGKAHPDFSISLSNLAGLYCKMGEYEKALPLYLAALENTENAMGKDHPDYALRLNNLAFLYQSIGEYELALALYENALTITEKALGNAHPSYAGALGNLASVYSSMGQYEKALPMAVEALNNTEKSLGKLHPEYGTRLNALGNLYSQLGEYQKALTFYLRALENTNNTLGIAHPDYGTCLNNLALLYTNVGDYEKALPLSLEALENTEKSLGKTHPEYGTRLSNLANLYVRMGDYKRALPLALAAIENTEKAFGKEHPDYGTRLGNLAVLYESMGAYEKALPLYLESLENIEQTLRKAHPNYGNSLNNLAILYKRDYDYKNAFPLIQLANQNLFSQMAQIFRFRSENEKEQFLETMTYYFDIYQSFGYQTQNEFPEINELNLNNQLILKGLLANASRSVFEDLRELEDLTIDNQIEAFKITQATLAHQYSLPVSQRNLNVDSLNQLSESQEAALVKLHNSKFGQTQTFSANWQDVQAMLKPGEVALEFSHFNYHNQKGWTDSTLYVAYVIKPDATTPEVVYLFEEKELEEVVKSQSPNGLYATRGAEDANKSFQLLSEELYNLIWRPLEQYLKPGDVVYFSPSGVLNQIALGAIPDSTGNLALTKYTLYQNNSTNNLVKGNAQPESAPAIFAGGIVYDYRPKSPNKNEGIEDVYNPTTLLADARGNQRGSTWNYLEGTKHEAHKLEELYRKKDLSVTQISGEQATEEWFKSLDGISPKVLHLATHGFFFENPKQQDLNTGQQPIYTLASDPLMRSGLILSHANYAWQNGNNPYEAEDGILTAYEISHMDLRNTDLVVLSACETGLGDIEGSEGVYGLQRAFKMAGVDYIIMSLWSVPDKETAEFMQLFYAYWLDGALIRDAFNQTQKDMSTKYFKTPEKWAAFVLVE